MRDQKFEGWRPEYDSCGWNVLAYCVETGGQITMEEIARQTAVDIETLRVGIWKCRQAGLVSAKRGSMTPLEAGRKFYFHELKRLGLFDLGEPKRKNKKG